MPDAMRAKDHRLILICLLVCAASLWIGIRYFYRAFPEASIQFNVDKESSAPIARGFLATQGISVDGFRHASAFLYDDETKVFLERQLGLKKANSLMGSEVKLWRWGHRWFRPVQKEEVRVEVTTRGEIASFLHTIAEDAPGADLPADAARSLAESFLFLEIGRPINELEFIDVQSQRRTARTDHVFTWQVRGADYAGADSRISVTIQGNRVDGFRDYLKIPEEWSRDYARLRSLNEGTSEVDLFFFVLLGVGMLVTLGRNVRLQNVRWSTALTFGAICFALQFLSSLNEFPLAEYGFDTTDSYAGFLGMTVLSATLEALAFGSIIALLTACVEPVYRQTCPKHISIPNILSWRALRTRSFFRATLVGISLTFFFVAYEIGFYLLANKLGAWSPAEVPYTNLLNTHFPWVFVLLGGFFPAVSEEWMFRAFSIPFLQKIMRRRWIGAVLAAFIWGFGHANYPNQPFYIRGVEVGLVGLVLAWAMFRFGILAPLIAHYSIDAFYSAFLLLRSGNTYLTVAGALTAGISLIPLMVAAGAYVVTRRFHPDENVSNQQEGFPAQPDASSQDSAVEIARIYTPLSRKAWWAAGAMLALGLLSFSLRAPRFGSTAEFHLTSTQAAQSARRFLAARQFSVDHYFQETQPISRAEPYAVQYIYTTGGVAALNGIYEKLALALVWRTRFYQPLQKEEFRVDVNPTDGRVVAFEHSLAEDAPGADLREPDARTIAMSFLKDENLDLSRFELQETRSEKLERRRDTTLVWQALASAPGAVGESRLRVLISVVGDKVGVWRDYIKVPEEWKRIRDRENLYAIAAMAVRGIFLAALFSAALVSLVRSIRRGIIRWRLVAWIAALAMLIESLDMINSIPAFRFRYDTQVLPHVFMLSGFVEAMLLLTGIGLAAAFAASLIMSCYADAPAVLQRKHRSIWGHDAVLAAAATLGAFLVLQWWAALLQYHASRFALAPFLSLPAGLGSYVPLISGIREVSLSALLYSAVLAFGVSLWKRLASRLWLRALLIAGLLGSFFPLTARRFSEVILDAASSALLVVLAALLILIFLRNNYPAYVFSTATLSVAHVSLSWLNQGNPGLVFQGCLLWLLVLGGAVFLLFSHTPWLPHRRHVPNQLG
jgi:membrane protease YdiL (CAAX protease family)